MIIVQLNGGFGNQLFQYAAGLCLAHNHKVEVKVDTTLLHQPDPVTGTKRKIEIFQLSNPPQEATVAELRDFLNQSVAKKLLEKSLPFYKRKVYKEKSNTFDDNFFKAGSHILLKGNRQSEKYFKTHEQHVRDAMQISSSAVAAVKSYAAEMRNITSISVHIRRGDYLTPVALEWLGLLPMAYYNTAIDTITSKIKGCKFFIFSDDIDWVKQNLEVTHEHEFVSGVISHNAIEDLYLMTQCRHNIIANSTFSWWGAWLNANANKVVIAPAKWYNKPGLDTSDLLPNEWMRL